jgi:hypothetical protein
MTYTESQGKTLYLHDKHCSEESELPSGVSMLDSWAIN